MAKINGFRDTVFVLLIFVLFRVRGGAVYDYLHLVAARKAGVERIVTLDLRHFRALARAGDPRIEGP